MNPLISSYGYLRVMLAAHLGQFRAARADGDRGASAVELAVITAIILGIAVALLAVIRIFVENQSAQIK
jgi:hypothetical protein